jgi:hypothetical protein
MLSARSNSAHKYPTLRQTSDARSAISGAASTPKSESEPAPAVAPAAPEEVASSVQSSSVAVAHARD